MFKVYSQKSPASIEIAIAIEIGKLSETDFDSDCDFDFGENRFALRSPFYALYIHNNVM